ncbi:winged helix-turn-helix domain-containing protein [Citrobacter rodentium]|uniref:Transmembrane regulator n=2 Tax=Citrobacter rodentium TaxID=67825 RepID=D2TJN5_CITRI|nr:membrane protein [Citrobacter rodentium]KIQ51424.1 membrane protein [Citrobacter rodentium]QBY29388.1 hypothetical protein E2R62_11300 [Citrobacter rodentium]UHO33210.1 hypothetical protein K7R23_11685 [Citrobacter rodentium NBRC 105723 = DSM 16636]CBG89673.1 putative transmembrane regulator [Citrobacter rodentium ICC168]HAT8015405.1 hypothetical protein [Citrobacter rodentium NBRC 105723 = DSM 16636]
MNAKKFLLDQRVLFDSVKMTLTQEDKVVRLSESECHLLLAFWQGLYKKEEIIHFVWKSRGGCVSESSYYKLINQLRNSFSNVGLLASDIVTRPRVGISLSVPMTPVDETPAPRITPDNTTADAEPVNLSPEPQTLKNADRRYLYLTASILFLLLVSVAVCLYHTLPRHEAEGVFISLGEFDGYHFYKMKGDKVTFNEVINAYTTMTLKIYRRNGRYIYYVREPDINIFFQCLNPVETAVPKCLTIKERY